MQKEFDAVLTELLTAGRVPSAVVSGADSVGSAGETSPKLLVAGSGGVDSMTLAHLLLHSSVPVQIVVAHCNFHLRGEESDGDEALVRDWCAANGVEFCRTDFDTQVYAQKNRLSIETAARELRYDWFAKLCAEKGCAALVVAHNANDNAETLFLNLLRGTGLRGLCGMVPLAVVPVGETAVTKPAFDPTSEKVAEPASAMERRYIPLLRPLLGFTRTEIETCARANNVRWREDSTNAANDCHRNILRNEVFPLLAEINPSFVRTLNREMQYFSDADDLVECIVPDILHDGKIDIDELLRYAHWPLFLFYLLRPYNFNSTVIDDIVEHIVAGLPNHIFLSSTHRLQITARNLLISERLEVAIPDTYIYNVGTYELAGKTITVELLDRGDLTDLKAPRGVTYLDADKVRFPFMLRGWRHGDWFRPLGMNGATKKVSDLFVDLKFSAAAKESAIFLTLPYSPKSQISALLGERIDDSVKIDSSTKKVLKISIQ
ncbi:MAG: tRNA lysidine(34) synthetase TilS [Bacteroidales bacterium]|nr:tRNA lysidine(34) synthetase TilS [Bacteroidales bacterium]